MRLAGFLSRAQVEMIHRNALRVLNEVGARVEHPGVRTKLAVLGGLSDETTERVRFPAKVIERLIADARKSRDENHAPDVTGDCGIYQSMYLDPDKNKLIPFNEERLAKYIGLAKSLPSVKSIGMLGVPFLPEGVPAEYLPLAEKLYAWKYGIGTGGGSVHFTSLCKPLMELFTCHASMNGKKIGQVFSAAGYLISPLKLARPECEQLLFFEEHGLHMNIGHLPTQGGTSPASFAGAIVQALAEQIFLYILHRAFREDAEFTVGGSVSSVDFRNGMTCYGRPEQQRINLAFSDIGRFYGCQSYSHTGLTDAKLPSCEAGAQKASGALITALATGCGSVSIGLLSLDEICSPVQMVMDDDITGGLKAVLADAVVNETECAFDEIAAAGNGGNHLGTDFTAARFRKEFFMPKTWSWQSMAVWQESGRRIDVDAAREIVHNFERKFVPESRMSKDEECELRAIIQRAVNSSAASA